MYVCIYFLFLDLSIYIFLFIYACIFWFIFINGTMQHAPQNILYTKTLFELSRPYVDRMGFLRERHASGVLHSVYPNMYTAYIVCIRTESDMDK